MKNAIGSQEASQPSASATAALIARACQVVPGGVHSGRRNVDPPFCVAKAKGAYIWDYDGRRYIDYQAGAGAVILGHADEVVDARVHEATERGTLYAVGTTEAEVELAEAIVQAVPSAEQVLFCNEGSRAVSNAIRLARAVTGRKLIIKFQGCYHGSDDAVLMNCQSDAARVGTPDPHSRGMLPETVSATLVCRFNDLGDVRATIAKHPDQVAAIIVEPVAHNGPGILPVGGFLEGLRDLATGCGALLIFDEIITGFRHHIGGYQAICGVMPDLTTLGKAVANGHAFAALAGRRELMHRFTTNPGGDVVWAGTYNGNAVGVAAALATIERLADPGIYRHLHALGEAMRTGLEEIAATLDVETTVCGFGSLFALGFMRGPVASYDDVARNDDDLLSRYRRLLMDGGVLEFPDRDGFRSHITASHTADDIARSLEIARPALVAAVRARAA